MKVSICKALASLALLLVLETQASAELLLRDSSRFGAHTIVVDSRTGLEWLNLTLSVGFSYYQAESATQTGGLFEGFRHATVAEVRGLWQSAGVPSTGWYAESSPEAQTILSLENLIGITSYRDGHLQSYAISGTPGGSGTYRVPALCFIYYDGQPSYGADTSLAYGPAFGNPGTGNWLVNAVPEPQPWLIWAGGGGLLLLATGRRKLLPQAMQSGGSI